MPTTDVLLILNINFLAFACIIFFKKSGNLKANRIISAGMVNVGIPATK